MFTDIEGFTALTERSDARDVLKVLDDYLAIVTDIVIEHGGMVDKLIGDGMFALFNVPLDLANHVERGIRHSARFRFRSTFRRRSSRSACAGFSTPSAVTVNPRPRPIQAVHAPMHHRPPARQRANASKPTMCLVCRSISG